jgi:hypothetical protein
MRSWHADWGEWSALRHKRAGGLPTRTKHRKYDARVKTYVRQSASARMRAAASRALACDCTICCQRSPVRRTPTRTRTRTHKARPYSSHLAAQR